VTLENSARAPAEVHRNSFFTDVSYFTLVDGGAGLKAAAKAREALRDLHDGVVPMLEPDGPPPTTPGERVTILMVVMSLLAALWAIVWSVVSLLAQLF
jgi:hypothetical protein